MSIVRFFVVTFSVLVVVDLADVNTGLPDACLQPKVEGPCKALFPRYFYNTVTSSCERFIYGGCLGNDNNFETEEACKIKSCLEPKVVGPCEALFQRYFYNTITFNCERFTYGDCLGNDNNFESEEACKIKCMTHVLG